MGEENESSCDEQNPHKFIIYGYELLEKTAKPGSNTSARVWVPKAWEGHRVALVRLD